MDWWVVVTAVMRLGGILRGLKARGYRGRVRTVLRCQFEDGTEEDFPFFTFEV